MTNIRLYLNTVRHLRPKQVIYQLLNRVSKLVDSRPRLTASYSPDCSSVFTLSECISSPPCVENKTFTFLNRSHTFEADIDWNFSANGKLWCYNLNYFAFLNQSETGKKSGLALINQFIRSAERIESGLEPYPTSLRIINWIKFMNRWQISDQLIQGSLLAQSSHLSKHLEYHLMGNHLFENAFALLYASYYFADKALYARAAALLRDELEEQILPDGGHYELSPMYHQIILEKMLDCINIIRRSDFMGREILPVIMAKASLMLGWLRQVTFANGEIPLVNDAAFGIAPTTAQLSAYADRLQVPTIVLPLSVSGYRKVVKPCYEILIDAGRIGPDYIPGHAHSDTFNFMLHVKENPLIVDTGISTYESTERRLTERGTSAHNTVEINGLNQSEVWGSFRVARRAYVRDLTETDDSISAWHDGYLRIGARHHRTFRPGESFIEIVDKIEGDKQLPAKAYLHFHPGVFVQLDRDIVHAGNTVISFAGGAGITLAEYQYAPEFNRLVPAKMIVISFTGSLVTRIEIQP